METGCANYRPRSPGHKQDNKSHRSTQKQGKIKEKSGRQAHGVTFSRKTVTRATKTRRSLKKQGKIKEKWARPAAGVTFGTSLVRVAITSRRSLQKQGKIKEKWTRPAAGVVGIQGSGGVQLQPTGLKKKQGKTKEKTMRQAGWGYFRNGRSYTSSSPIVVNVTENRSVQVKQSRNPYKIGCKKKKWSIPY